eukprot:15324816-Heterocapsa_arctica.AAC.1
MEKTARIAALEEMLEKSYSSADDLRNMVLKSISTAKNAQEMVMKSVYSESSKVLTLLGGSHGRSENGASPHLMGRAFCS